MVSVATTPSSAMLPLSTSACAARNARAGSTLCAPRRALRGAAGLPSHLAPCRGARQVPDRRARGELNPQIVLAWQAPERRHSAGAVRAGHAPVTATPCSAPGCAQLSAGGRRRGRARLDVGDGQRGVQDAEHQERRKVLGRQHRVEAHHRDAGCARAHTHARASCRPPTAQRPPRQRVCPTGCAGIAPRLALRQRTISKGCRCV